ncbi:MAG: hypothetical protein OEM26_14345, partial [Saprospiraceae bacterium]|nr:hypothetical protein [Saprospiraceae bacterium]
MKSHTIEGLGVPDQLIQSNRHLQDDLANLEERVLQAATKGDTVLLKKLSVQYFERSDSLKRVQNQINVHYPQYFRLTTKLSPVTPAAIQSQLESEQCVIEFFWGDDQIYRMIATRDTLLYNRLGETGIIEQSLDQWLKELHSPEFTGEGLGISTDSINS